MSFTVPFPVIPKRKITGMSAVLLPYTSDHAVDWKSFGAHLERTLEAGLVPAVNMDTGYINLLDEATKAEVLRRTAAITSGQRFVAGAFVADEPGSGFDISAYSRRIEDIEAAGGIPVIFQSYGLTGQSDDAIVASYQLISAACGQFIAFELGEMFLPFGKIYSADVYRQLLQMKNCIGAKHSSLRRELEWERLVVRNEVRPDFLLLTGNDLAIDMVMYGSDYLLGLSSFCPELFAKRDALWESGAADFYQLNDVLQYLGYFAFRNPVPAYKHSCAQFLYLQGKTASSLTHPSGVCRPDSDVAVLQGILDLLSDY